MDRHAERAARNIERAGEKVALYEKTGGTENGFGKTDGGSDTKVDDAWVALSDDSGETMQKSDGEVNQYTPTGLIPRRADVRSGLRFTIRGITYEIQNVVPLATHYKVALVSVNG